jgi:hypothetical protein
MHDAGGNRVWQVTVCTVDRRTDVEYTQVYTTPVDRDVSWTESINMATVELKRTNGPRDPNHLVERVIIDRISLIRKLDDSHSHLPKGE